MIKPYSFQNLALLLFVLLSKLSPGSTQNISLQTLDRPAEFCSYNVTPIRYEINIDPINFPENCNNFASDCLVTAWTKITIHVNNRTCDKDPVLILNPRGCFIDTKNVKIVHPKTGKSVKILNQYFPQKNSSEVEDVPQIEYHLKMEGAPTFPNQLEVYIPYSLNLTRDSYEESWQGFYFYSSLSTNSAMEIYEHYPLHTRHMFPTFDQNPFQKSSFKVHVSRRASSGFVTIGNMDVEKTVPILGNDSGWVKDTFRESTPLPTDQIAVLIFKGFEKFSVHDPKKDNRTVNLWKFEWSEDENTGGNHTAKEIMKLLQFYEEKLNGTEYPGQKLDVVAVPWWPGGICRFSSLGLVINYEGNVIDPRNYEWLSAQIVLQWFGGIVTMEQITGTGENTGDVNGLVQYLATWSSREFLGESVAPFEMNAETFLLTMMEDVFGREVMEVAVANFYLPKIQGNGGAAPDFWDALQQALAFQNRTHLLPSTKGQLVTVKEIQETWSHCCAVYPRLLVSMTVAGNSSNSSYLISQVAPENPDCSSSSQHYWWVPVKILTDTGTSEVVWLPPNNETLSGTLNNGKWFLVNPTGQGYYSVEYDENLLGKIIGQLIENHTEIPSTARNYLIHNQFTIGGEYGAWEEMKGALEMTRYLGKEKNWNVWATALSHIKSLEARFYKNEEGLALFQNYFGLLVNSVLEDVGVTGGLAEEESIVQLRSKLVKYCDRWEIPVCQKVAVDVMTDWRSKPEMDPFSPRNLSDLRQTLSCVAVRAENENQTEVFDFLLERALYFQNDSDSSWWVSRQIVEILTCSKNGKKLAELLNNPELEEMTRDVMYSSIVLQNPFTMTTIVYRFLMKEVLEGRFLPASFLRHLWMLIPGGYKPPGFEEMIFQFLDENKNLFEGEDDHLRDLKASFNYEQYPTTKFWESGIGDKVRAWLAENSRKV